MKAPMNPEIETRMTEIMSAFILPILSEMNPMTNEPTSMPNMYVAPKMLRCSQKEASDLKTESILA